METKKILFLNGEFIEFNKAQISIHDYGFNFACGIYEVIRIYNDIPFQLYEHLKRFEESAKLIGLEISVDELKKVCMHLIKVNLQKNGTIYIQATFGNYNVRSHKLPEKIIPTLLVYTNDFSDYSKNYYVSGVRLKTVIDDRWENCHIKSIALLPNLISLNKSIADGYNECIMIDRDNRNVYEGATSNVFCVKDKELYTPPKSNKTLSGITRSVVIEVAKSLGISIKEVQFDEFFLKSSDEIFITSTTKEVMPANCIDDVKLLISNSDSIVKQIMKGFLQRVEDQTMSMHWKRSLFEL